MLFVSIKIFIKISLLKNSVNRSLNFKEFYFKFDKKQFPLIHLVSVYSATSTLTTTKFPHILLVTRQTICQSFDQTWGIKARILGFSYFSSIKTFPE